MLSTAVDLRRDWTPNEGPQRAFAESPIKDVCYGGARVGGKTTGLLFVAKKREEKYGSKFRAVIFRKSYPELAEVIRKGQVYLVGQLGWKYVSQPHYTFTSPQGGTLMVRYAETLEDARKYDGFEWTDMYFDEIGNWATPEVCDYLLGCLRSGDRVPVIRRSTCMPGGPGHVWVKERYRPDAPPYTVRLLTNKEHPEFAMESVFIPGKMEDNPSIDPREYEISLAAAATGPLYEAWRHGNWDVVTGAFFDCWNPETIVVPAESVVMQPWDVRWMSGDWGFRDDCVIHWHAQDENGNITTYRELKVNQTNPADLGRLIAKMNDGEKMALFAFSPDAWAERASPRTIASEVAAELMAAGVTAPSRADTDREGGWMLMYQLLQLEKWRISSACPELIRAIPLMQVNPKNSADIDESPFDHAPDSARYGLKTYLKTAKVPHDEMVRRYVKEKMETMPVAVDAVSLETEYDEDDRAGQIIGPTREPVGATDWNRIAMLTRQGEAKHRRTRLRPKAKGYGRMGA